MRNFVYSLRNSVLHHFNVTTQRFSERIQNCTKTFETPSFSKLLHLKKFNDGLKVQMILFQTTVEQIQTNKRYK